MLALRICDFIVTYCYFFFLFSPRLSLLSLSPAAAVSFSYRFLLRSAHLWLCHSCTFAARRTTKFEYDGAALSRFGSADERRHLFVSVSGLDVKTLG